MSFIPADKQLTLNIRPAQTKTSAQPIGRTTPPSSPAGSPTKVGLRRPPLNLPGFAPPLMQDAAPAALRAFTAPNLPNASKLLVPTQASRAQSTAQVSKAEGPSPSATFADLAGAKLTSPTADAHAGTAKAMAIVIQTGKEGLKTVFGYDALGHVVFGSHDELEMNKSASTQHSHLLRRIVMSMKNEPGLDEGARKFSGELMRAVINPAKAASEGVLVGGTRFKEEADGRLTFTVSQGFGFKNVTPEVLEPVAQFHANVLRLAGMADKPISGDGDATEALAKRVSELLA